LLEESLEEVIIHSKDLANPLWNRYNNKYLLTLNFFLKPELRSEEGFVRFIQENIIAQLEKNFQKGVNELHGRTKEAIMNLNLYNFASSDTDDSNKSPIEIITENLA
jgi:hypothetical protein